MEAVATKRCGDCGEVKPTIEFAVKMNTRDRLHSYCRQCAAARTRRWRMANGERNRMLQGRVLHRPGSGKRRLARVRANRYLGRAQGPCEYCGSMERPTYHHEDHDHPCVVMVLCEVCNFRRDDKLARWPELNEWCERRFAELLEEYGEQLALFSG